MPEMTGETANGRSISVMSRFVPGNRNFAIAQPAAHAEDQIRGHGDRGGRAASASSAASASGSTIASGIRAHARCERLDEDHRQRQHEEQPEERERDRDQRPAQRRAAPSGDAALGVALVALRATYAGHQLSAPGGGCSSAAAR